MSHQNMQREGEQNNLISILIIHLKGKTSCYSYKSETKHGTKPKSDSESCTYPFLPKSKRSDTQLHFPSWLYIFTSIAGELIRTFFRKCKWTVSIRTKRKSTMVLL